MGHSSLLLCLHRIGSLNYIYIYITIVFYFYYFYFITIVIMVSITQQFLQCLMNQEYLAAKVLCRKGD